MDVLCGWVVGASLGGAGDVGSHLPAARGAWEAVERGQRVVPPAFHPMF